MQRPVANARQKVTALEQKAKRDALLCQKARHIAEAGGGHFHLPLGVADSCVEAAGHEDKSGTPLVDDWKDNAVEESGVFGVPTTDGIQWHIYGVRIFRKNIAVGLT